MKERKNVNSVSELLVLYRSYLEDEERSAATVDKYLRDVKAFMEYLAGEKAVGNPDSEKQDHASGQEEKTVLLPAVDREVIRNYKQALKERYKIASANSMLAALNSFFVLQTGTGNDREGLRKAGTGGQKEERSHDEHADPDHWKHRNQDQ